MSRTAPELVDLLAKLKALPTDQGLHIQCVDAFVRILHSDKNYFFEFRPEILEILRFLFAGNEINHQKLEPLATGQIKLKYGLPESGCDSVEENLVTSLANDELFIAILEKCYVTDLYLESLLIAIRRFLLYRFLQDGEMHDAGLRLAIAMAQQAFNNEYVWLAEPEELHQLAALNQTIAGANLQSSGQGSVPLTALAILGMYQSLLQFANSPAFHLPPSPGPGSHFSEAIQRMVTEPLQEKALAKSIPCLKPLQNQVSLEVQSHYEENPFPRWFSLGGPHRSVEARLQSIRPGFRSALATANQKSSILVAGCGTGQHPLSVAAGSPDADVLAIDLSLASLAYGKRMSLRYGIKNITFMQGDLLDISLLQRQFDHVECVGVLHCLEKPVLGWQVLNQVLAPGGTFRVAVYSKLARIHIEAVRRMVSREGLKASPQDMRQFRFRLIHDSSYALLRECLLCRDFFSLSMFRDLVFHAHEYGYELQEMLENINKLGLNFLGFYTDESLRRLYVKKFPDDPYCNNLDYWKQFEVHYLGSGQMFSCWLQKPV